MSALTNGADDGAHGELVPVGPPPALRWNLWATGVWSALSVLANLVLFGQRPYLRKSLIDQNAKSAKPTPAAEYLTKVDHDVHSQLVGGLIEALLVTVILVLLAGLTWRGRRWARWVLLALAVAGLPFRVGVVAQLVLGVVPSSVPGVYRFVLILAGIAAVAVVVLLMHRTTREYFAALKATQRGTLPAVPGARIPGSPRGSLGSTGARPAGGGLGALFAPRRRPGPAPQSDAAATIPAGNDSPPDGTSPDVTAVTEPSSTNASRRPTATRPGSVKAKGGGGNRSGRFKSRQQ